MPAHLQGKGKKRSIPGNEYDVCLCLSTLGMCGAVKTSSCGWEEAERDVEPLRGRESKVNTPCTSWKIQEWDLLMLLFIIQVTLFYSYKLHHLFQVYLQLSCGMGPYSYFKNGELRAQGELSFASLCSQISAQVLQIH